MFNDNMPLADLIGLLFTLHLPALVICGIFFAFGLKTKSPWAGRLLRWSAVIWLIVLWAIYGFVIMGFATCEGSMLYGYTRCSLIRGLYMNYTLPAFSFGTAAAVIWGVFAALVAGFWEWRHRKRGEQIASDARLG